MEEAVSLQKVTSTPLATYRQPHKPGSWGFPALKTTKSSCQQAPPQERAPNTAQPDQERSSFPMPPEGCGRGHPQGGFAAPVPQKQTVRADPSHPRSTICSTSGPPRTEIPHLLRRLTGGAAAAPSRTGCV